NRRPTGEAAPQRTDLRRDVALRDRLRRRRRDDHELQRVARGHADRACAATARGRGGDRDLPELRRRLRPHGESGGGRLPHPHEVLVESVPEVVRKTSAEQPKTSAGRTSASATPASEGCARSTDTSGHDSIPSAAAPSSEPKQSSEPTEITLRRPAWRRATPSSSRSSSSGSMRTFESEPMQTPIPRSQSAATGT